MAVKHLQNVQKQQLAIAMASDPTVLQKFKSGFSECSDEVINYVGQMDVDAALKQRLKNHLNKCITSVEQMAQFNIPTITYPFIANGNGIFGGSPNKNCDITSTAGDQNNNPRIQIPQGLQLIPSRLPTGEFAFLVPNSNNMPCFSSLASSSKPQPEHNIQSNTRPSAFAAVIPSANSVRLLSPPLSPAHSNSSQNDDVVPTNQQNRSPSPHGFRPVNPGQRRNIFIPTMPNSELIQREPLSQHEVKTIRYSINNNLERKYVSPRKIVEPLCIITNQGERFKQAQTLVETANYEENRQHGVKRKLNEGLLSIAINQDMHSKCKIMKMNNKEAVPSTSSYLNNHRIIDNERDSTSDASSKDNAETSNDMWRPW